MLGAEYLLDHGMLDRVTPRPKMRDELITIVRMLLKQPPAVRGDLPAPEPEQTQTKEISDKTQRASPASKTQSETTKAETKA